MKAPWKLLVAGVLAAGPALAADEARTQDPPGGVGVDQPAGVSAEDRNSERDPTDTLRGGATDAIEGEREGRRAGGVIVQPSEGRGSVEQGGEARTSFGGTGSGASGGEAAPEADEEAGPSESTPSTHLGTDTGYGTGTEPPPGDAGR